MNVNMTMNDMQQADREYNATQKATEAVYPVGSVWTTPNGDADVVRVEHQTVTLRMISTGATESMVTRTLDYVVKTGQFVRK